MEEQVQRPYRVWAGVDAHTARRPAAGWSCEWVMYSWYASSSLELTMGGYGSHCGGAPPPSAAASTDQHAAMRRAAGWARVATPGTRGEWLSGRAVLAPEGSC
jgi:hypothetical protein